MSFSVVQVVGNVAMGGAERHARDLVAGLRARDVEVHVVCARLGPLVEQLRSDGVSVRCLEMAFPRPGDEYGLDWAAVEQLEQYLRERQPEVVHSHLYPAHLHASLAATRAGVPGVVHTAHTLVVRPGDALLGRLTPVHIIATSQVVRQLQAAAGVPHERIDVIYNGVGDVHFETQASLVTEARRSLGLGEGPVLGVVSRLSPEKGIDVLLHATQHLSRRIPNTTLIVAGDGPEWPRLRALARELDLEGVVRFLGARTDVAVLNRLFDIFALPSREEACSIALLEAMAAGCAVVATGVGGSVELIKPGVDGCLVPADDPEALAEAIYALMLDPARRSALGQAARRAVANRFTLAGMVEQTLNLYQRLLRIEIGAGTTAPLAC
ncbi:MAG: glycosyltransferase [Chloroflexi bacterium]|nr:glycosyltransferase [Chloroflexota bacterium]